MKKVPSIEEIYNYYHQTTMFEMKGFYPRSIKNFEKVLTNTNKELLTKFQNFIIKNGSIINWKLYVLSLAKYYKTRFDLKLLGSLAGTKIYKQYVNFINAPENLTEKELKEQLVNSLLFLVNYIKDENTSLKEYFNLDSNIIPVYIKHINSGSVSKILYSCFPWETRVKMFFNTPDDIFYEFFSISKNQFIENLEEQRKMILKYKSIRDIMKKIENKYI